MIVGVYARGETAMLAAGSRARGGPPVDGNTIFKVCSVTKVLTGVLLADAIERGNVRLDDEAQLYLHRVKLPTHAGGPIRVEHLATYRALEAGERLVDVPVISDEF
jgi:CubicO group peptidase (beta-lactamase class C family)